jgi:hypothetical protein
MGSNNDEYEFKIHEREHLSKPSNATKTMKWRPAVPLSFETFSEKPGRDRSLRYWVRTAEEEDEVWVSTGGVQDGERDEGRPAESGDKMVRGID